MGAEISSFVNGYGTEDVCNFTLCLFLFFLSFFFLRLSNIVVFYKVDSGKQFQQTMSVR